MNWRDYLNAGIAAEKALADRLVANVPGLLITHVEASAGAKKGPRVRGMDFGDLGELTDNDFHAIFDDNHFDIQLKLKTRANWRGYGHYYEHGMDLPAYHQYQHKYEASATRMLLMIWEVERSRDGQGQIDPKTLAQWFHRLPRPRLGDPDPAFKQGSANWPRWSFLQVIDNDGKFLFRDDGKQVMWMLLRGEFAVKASIQRPLILPKDRT